MHFSESMHIPGCAREVFGPIDSSVILTSCGSQTMQRAAADGMPEYSTPCFVVSCCPLVCRVVETSVENVAPAPTQQRLHLRMVMCSAWHRLVMRPVVTTRLIDITALSSFRLEYDSSITLGFSA